MNEFWPAFSCGCAINCTERSGGEGLKGGSHRDYEINCTNLPELVGTFVRNSLAPNTLRAYASDLAMFIQWGGSLPAPPQLIAAFLAAHARSHASSTLSRYLAAISKVHRVRSWPDPTTSELVKATMRGIRRSGLEVRETAPHRAMQKQAPVYCLFRLA